MIVVKKPRKPRTPNRDRGVFVMLTADELAAIEAVVPEEMSASEWCRIVLLRVARPRCVKSTDLEDDSAA